MQTPVQNIVREILAAFHGEEGFTIHAKSGDRYVESGYYLVGGVIPSLEFSASRSLFNLGTEVEEWYRGALALHTHDPLVGGWVHNGTIHLDLVTRVSNLEDALLLGKLWNQAAIGKLDDDDDYEEFAVISR